MTFAALAAVVSASAFGLKEPQRLSPAPDTDIKSVEIPAQFISPNHIETRAVSRGEAEEVYYTLAGDPYNCFGYQNQTPGLQIGQAMQMEPEFVTKMAGSEITKVVFHTGTEYGLNENKIKRATVFVTNDLMGDPIATKETTCPSQPGAKVEVALDAPLTIESGKKYYVGVYCTLNSADNCPVTSDFIAHDNDYGGWVGVRTSPKSAWSWDNISTSYGFVCVGAIVKSTEFSHDEVAITAIDGVPVNYQNTPFEVDFLYINNGANDVNNIKVEYNIDGEEIYGGVVNMPSAVGFNKSAVIRIPEVIAEQAAKTTNVNVRVTEVNGKPNTSAEGTAQFPVTIIPTGKGYLRNVVVEEFTSTSCSFCPVGYTALEYVHENYTNGDLIPVAVHVNTPGSDPMTATSFNNVVNRYFGGSVPSAIMNRTFDVYPTPDNIVDMFEQVRSLPALASITAEGTYDPATGKVKVDTKTSFSFDHTDGDKNFALSYAVTENNVGPYTQQNGYSGATGDYLGWQNQPATVQLVYNDVARQLDSFTGVKGSVPAEITSGTEYTFSHDVKLLTTINNPDKLLNIIVYLINKTTGAVENAAMLRAGTIPGLAGIENVAADAADPAAPVEYYNLQGQRVMDPAPGTLLIRRQGSTATKVLL